MKNNEDILKKILLHMKYDSSKTLSENKMFIINEGTDKCRDKYWWIKEKQDPNNKSAKVCWNGVDPLSCDLRKILRTYNLRTAFCANLGNVRCGWIKYTNQCAFGAQGDNFNNTFIPTKGALRNESIVISPITNNESELQVNVFIERKKLVESLTKLFNKKGSTMPYVDLPKSSAGIGTQDKYDDSDSTVFWKASNASDQFIQSVLGLLKNNTSIPFFEETGEVVYQRLYVKDEPKTFGINDIVTKGGFNFNKVKEEFGSTGTLEDNTKLLNAWNSGWRPGKEVPEKYQTEKYKTNTTTNTTVKQDNPNIKNSDEEMIIVGDGEGDGSEIKVYLSGDGN